MVYQSRLHSWNPHSSDAGKGTRQPAIRRRGSGVERTGVTARTSCYQPGSATSYATSRSTANVGINIYFNVDILLSLTSSPARLMGGLRGHGMAGRSRFYTSALPRQQRWPRAGPLPTTRLLVLPRRVQTLDRGTTSSHMGMLCWAPIFLRPASAESFALPHAPFSPQWPVVMSRRRTPCPAWETESGDSQAPFGRAESPAPMVLEIPSSWARQRNW